jgi:hypothetical protein
MTEEEMRQLASDLRRFAELHTKKTAYSLQFENTAVFIDVVADRIRRANNE